MKKLLLVVLSLALITIVFQSCRQGDLQIKQDVEKVLEQKYPSVFASVDNGVVTLTGIVDSLSVSKNAEDAVSKVDNVKRVKNKIEIYNATKAASQNH